MSGHRPGPSLWCNDFKGNKFASSLRMVAVVSNHHFPWCDCRINKAVMLCNCFINLIVSKLVSVTDKKSSPYAKISVYYLKTVSLWSQNFTFNNQYPEKNILKLRTWNFKELHQNFKVIISFDLWVAKTVFGGRSKLTYYWENMKVEENFSDWWSQKLAWSLTIFFVFKNIKLNKIE